jgi:hypothetical protein
LESDKDGREDEPAPLHGASTVEAREAAPHQEIGGNEASEAQQALIDRIDKSDRWMIGLTAVIATAGIVSAIIFGWQLHVMQGQFDEMKSSSADTKSLVGATTNQAEAARIAANSITEQLAIQRETLNRAYRPRVSAELISVGDFSVTQEEFRGAITFIFHNYGTLPAEDVETQVALMPLNKAIREQERVCREATIFQTLHMDNLRKQNFPETYAVIPQNQGSPLRREFGFVGKSADFRDDSIPPESPRAKWTNPAAVGCIAYRGADDKKVHYTRFLYDFTERGPDGNPTFITVDPHTIAAASVVIRRWAEAGNSED